MERFTGFLSGWMTELREVFSNVVNKFKLWYYFCSLYGSGDGDHAVYRIVIFSSFINCPFFPEAGQTDFIYAGPLFQLYLDVCWDYHLFSQDRRAVTGSEAVSVF